MPLAAGCSFDGCTERTKLGDSVAPWCRHGRPPRCGRPQRPDKSHASLWGRGRSHSADRPTLLHQGPVALEFPIPRKSPRTSPTDDPAPSICCFVSHLLRKQASSTTCGSSGRAQLTAGRTASHTRCMGATPRRTTGAYWSRRGTVRSRTAERVGARTRLHTTSNRDERASDQVDCRFGTERAPVASRVLGDPEAHRRGGVRGPAREVRA